MATIWEASSKLIFSFFIKAINHILYSFVHLVLCLGAVQKSTGPSYVHTIFTFFTLPGALSSIKGDQESKPDNDDTPSPA